MCFPDTYVIAVYDDPSEIGATNFETSDKNAQLKDALAVDHLVGDKLDFLDRGPSAALSDLPDEDGKQGQAEVKTARKKSRRILLNFAEDDRLPSCLSCASLT